MELSLVITAHDEGLLAHKTMLSVFQALKHVSGKHETIIHIDKGSPETVEYFQRYVNSPDIRIFENQFGDAGAARNFCVQQARGKYIIFTDADDLLSENYLSLMLSTLQSCHEDIVVHPEYNISFWDERYLVWKTISPRSREEAAYLLFSRNQWPSSCGARRDIFLKHPYILTQNGFGHEDYALNIALSADHIRHQTVPSAITFYRQKSRSLLRQNDAKRATQPYSELFDIKFWQSFQVGSATQEKTQFNLRQTLRRGYITARDNRTLNAIIEPIATVARKVTGKKLIRSDLPKSVMAEWRKIAEIESGLYPAPGVIRNLDYYDPNISLKANAAYRELCQQSIDYADYIFIVPWLVPGGADKVVLNYLKALREIRPEWRIAVVTTLPSKNSWKNQISDNAFLVDFGNAATKLEPADKELLFTRLITQLRAKKLHIVNSLYGYQWTNLYHDFVKHNYEVYLSLFCHDIIPGTNGRGHFDYADPYALRIYPLVKKIYTDNSAVINRLVELNAFDAKKFKVHYQPTAAQTSLPRSSRPKQPLRILWASRVAVQKNPELLLRIAKKLDPAIAHIDVYGRKDRECAQFNFPKSLPTITYHGSFDGFDSLELAKYDLLLYTSRIDGLPNILLEATSAGLPIIASKAGGIGDFIRNGETGFLVDDADNEKAYIEVINQIAQHPEQLDPLVQNAQTLLNTRHAWSTFLETIREDF